MKISHKKVCHFKKVRDSGDGETGGEALESSSGPLTGPAEPSQSDVSSQSDFIGFQREFGLLDYSDEDNKEDGGASESESNSDEEEND